MSPGTCKHFTGLRMGHDLCSRGVAYAQFEPGIPCIKFIEKSARGGTYIRAGETPVERKPWPNPSAKACPFYAEPTTEQVEADRRESDAALQRAMAGLKAVAAWKVRPKPALDRSEVIECPVCNGRLHVTQSAYNGHASARCETERCVHFVE